MRRLSRDQRGANIVEHALCIALVALAALGAWTLLGDETEQSVRCAAAAIAGGGGAPCVEGASAPNADATDPDGAPRPGGASESTTERSLPAPTDPALPPTETRSSSPIEDLFAFGGGFVSGFVDAGVGMVTGLVDLGVASIRASIEAVTHPGETAQALSTVATHLDRAPGAAGEVVSSVATGVWHGVEHVGDVLVNGTPYEKGRIVGAGTFEVVSTVVPVSKIGAVGHAAQAVGHAVPHASAAFDAASAAAHVGEGGGLLAFAGVVRRLEGKTPSETYRRFIQQGLSKEDAASQTAIAYGIAGDANLTLQDVNRLLFLKWRDETGMLRTGALDARVAGDVEGVQMLKQLTRRTRRISAKARALAVHLTRPIPAGRFHSLPPTAREIELTQQAVAELPLAKLRALKHDGVFFRVGGSESASSLSIDPAGFMGGEQWVIVYMPRAQGAEEVTQEILSRTLAESLEAAGF